MKIIGDQIFAKDAEGNLLSRIGTIFFRTSGLVTVRGSHSMQRQLWLSEIKKEQQLTKAEEDAELSESVDLVFTENHVLIRPDPERMDLAFKADEVLQQFMSKRRIRFLNTNSLKVRAALRERGENWRMSRHPISMEDYIDLIERSKVSIGEGAIYYYNRASGTHYVTPASYNEVAKLPAEAYRRQVKEMIDGLGRKNRHGHPEVDLFPVNTSSEVKAAYRAIKVDELSDAELRAAVEKVNTVRRMLMPPELRDESIENPSWRTEMCETLVRTPGETSSIDQQLIAGITANFFRQIEWLPGARIVNGEVVFDEVFEEAERTQDPGLLALCDSRVKALIFNTMRLFGKMAYINVGRIANSVRRHPVYGYERGKTYIMQSREVGTLQTKVFIIRLQKYGVAERLDEGKDLLQAIQETDEYSDYILDRRLMCRHLGMNLPNRIGFGSFCETYHGENSQYEGTTIHTRYIVREYVPGLKSEKVSVTNLHDVQWANKFAALMGEAAAVDSIVGRRSSETKELMFDKLYETVVLDDKGLPKEVKIADHAGTFVNYEHPLIAYVPQYANFARRRKQLVLNYPDFVEAYVEGFRKRLIQVKNAYSARTAVFENLLKGRPYDTNGSGAYRWACILKRIAEYDPEACADTLKAAIEC